VRTFAFIAGLLMLLIAGFQTPVRAETDVNKELKELKEELKKASKLLEELRGEFQALQKQGEELKKARETLEKEEWILEIGKKAIEFFELEIEKKTTGNQRGLFFDAQNAQKMRDDLKREDELKREIIKLMIKRKR